MKLTFFTAKCSGNAQNCLYPNKIEVTDAQTLSAAVRFDHVMAEYQNHYRSKDNFIWSDCLGMDCDNDHSDNPADWISVDDIKAAFPDVAFAVAYSRHHNLPKGTKSARPRFHVYFQITAVTDWNIYTMLKRKVQKVFPFFDKNALDAARFFFGTDTPQVEIIDGELELDTYFCLTENNRTIPIGGRNNHMSRYAGKVLKRLGDTEKAYSCYLEEAAKCDPPLDNSELQTIWNSAKRFYKKVSAQKGYIPPDEYGNAETLKPGDYSDVGQASVLAVEYHDVLRYSPYTDYLCYNGSHWEESKPKSHGIIQELTTRQLSEAEAMVSRTQQAMEECGAMPIFTKYSAKKAMQEFNEEQMNAYLEYAAALAYHKFVMKRRESRQITAALKEAEPMLEIDIKDIDNKPFLLNTPSFTYDIRKGLNGKREHNCEDYITKCTTFDPSDEGKDLWNDTLEKIFCGDKDLIEYVQLICGMASYGKVYVEALIIAHGDGRNGKSTFWNVISRVMGTYGGNLSADSLTVGCRRNVKPELAEAKGKRLLIAAELEEGTRLNTANVKQLCSTDDIYAEKKFKDPFSYTPTHTLVLYTNHLPKVGACDAGTWRRLIVIPFKAVIEGAGDIKNYADYLYENAGGAVLSWIIEGARKVYKQGFKIDMPDCVKAAINGYREDNDWLSQYLTECCEVSEAYIQKSGELYSDYRSYCARNNLYTRSTTDFYSALENAGFVRERKKSGVLVKGLRLKTDAELDFLN